MNSGPNLVRGTPVVIDKKVAYLPVLPEEFELNRVYRIQSVDIVPRKTILSQDYIDVGYIPEVVREHCSMPNGIWTTNHDLMGSDCIVTVRDHKFSGAFFRLATADEVRQEARTTL